MTHLSGSPTDSRKLPVGSGLPNHDRGMSAGGLPYHDRVSSIEEKLRGLDVFILAAMQAFQIDSVELYNDRSITLQKEYSAGCQSAPDLISISTAERLTLRFATL